MSATTDDIRKLEDRRFQAMAAADVAALQELLADDLVYTHSNALVDSKHSLIDAIGGGRIRYKKIDRPVEDVRVFGDAAVVTGQARMELHVGSGTRVLNIRYTNVWINDGGAWRMAAWQSTPIPG